MNIAEILQNATIKLKENHIEEPITKTRRLLAHTLNVQKEYLITHEEQEVDEKKEKEYLLMIDKLINGKPMQYIIGTQEFMGIEFAVNENVLIPQPDTEILVEKTIEIAKNISVPKILDLCTGSGAIAISIAKYISEAKITATDISKDALEVASKNDKENRVEFIESDLFQNIHEKFDIIVSNPPYIKTEEIKVLSKEVQNEPLIALDGGQDGLFFYKNIIKEASKYMKNDAYLCLEIGEDQKQDVINLIEKDSNYSLISTYKDLGNNDRVIIAKKI